MVNAGDWGKSPAFFLIHDMAVIWGSRFWVGSADSMDFPRSPAESFHSSRRGYTMITDYELHQLRADRGQKLSSQVTQHANGFYVRSQSGNAKVYNVRIEGGQWRCDCDDFRYRAEDARMRFDFNCKHILATQFAMKFGTVHGTRSIEETRERVAAKQSGAPRRRTYSTGFIPH